MNLKLKPIERGIFEATIADQPCVVAYRRRNRQSEDTVNNSITFNPEQIDRARTLARNRDHTCYIVGEVALKDKPLYAFAIPFGKWHTLKSSKADFNVGPKAREEYAKDDTIHKYSSVTVLEADKPAPKQKTKSVRLTKAGRVAAIKAGAVPAAPASAVPGEPAIRKVKWAPEEEAQIARHIAEGLTRKSAIQKMQRAKKIKAQHVAARA